MKVLLIDDEEDIRKVALLSLEAVGKFEARCAASAAEGLASARADRPDVILLDMMMPTVDGLTALTELRGTPQLARVPVIIMSARIQPGEQESWIQRGAAGVIRKPFDPMTLPSEIRRIVEGTRS